MNPATYVRQQHAAFLASDATLDGYPDAEAVHDARVALRRLRSTLRVFRLPWTALDDEMRWYAAILGDVRDIDVLREHLAESLRALPVENVLGPVAAQIGEHLQTSRQAALATIREARDSKRYRELLAALQHFADTPAPFDGVAERATKARRTARRRLRAAADDVTFHRARKAAKRARYAAEATGGTGRRWKRVQDRLGTHQDTVYARAVLRQLALAHPASGFTYGLLYEQETERARRSRQV